MVPLLCSTELGQVFALIKKKTADLAGKRCYASTTQNKNITGNASRQFDSTPVQQRGSRLPAQQLGGRSWWVSTCGGLYQAEPGGLEFPQLSTDSASGSEYKLRIWSCRDAFFRLYKCWDSVEGERIRHPDPLHPCLGRPLPAVSDFCIQKQRKKTNKKSFIGTCEGWHVHESPLRSSILVVLIVYYSPCTAVFLQIWFTVSLIL